MNPDQDQLWTERRGRGPAEAALDKTLAAWSSTGHLNGPENAAARATLRDSARAADKARTMLAAGFGSPTQLASCAKNLATLLNSYAPRRAEHSIDPIDALLSQLSATPLRDTTQP